MGVAAIWGYRGLGEALSASESRGRELHLVHGLDPATPLVVSATERTAGSVEQTITDMAGVVTVERE